MMQRIEQTEAQKIQMYKKCNKKELIKMLIEANLHLESIVKNMQPKLYPFNEQL